VTDAPDFCTAAGAQALADRISDHWRKRGFAGVRVWIESVPILNSNVTQFKGGRTYQIKSNISQILHPKRGLKSHAVATANK
jgi:hypothetical protein